MVSGLISIFIVATRHSLRGKVFEAKSLQVWAACVGYLCGNSASFPVFPFSYCDDVGRLPIERAIGCGQLEPFRDLGYRSTSTTSQYVCLLSWPTATLSHSILKPPHSNVEVPKTLGSFPIPSSTKPSRSTFSTDNFSGTVLATIGSRRVSHADVRRLVGLHGKRDEAACNQC